MIQQPIIHLDNISKSFRRHPGWFPSEYSKGNIPALKNVTWTLEQGQVIALAGPNGAGKTTLLRILATLLIPDTGHVTIQNWRLPEQAASVRPLLGFSMGDDRSFYWRLTVRQNLEFFAALYNLSSDQSRQRIRETSQILELRDILDRRFEALSTGTRQRVSLARALLSNPAIILADEPTRSLDPLSKISFQKLLVRLSRDFNRTVFFTTHDLQEAETTADTLGILVQGQLKAAGKPCMVAKSYASVCEENHS